MWTPEPLAVAFLALVLSACHGGPSTEEKFATRQREIDPPELWLMEDRDAAGVLQASTWVCADTPMRASFLRTRTEVAGTQCNDVTAPVVRSGFSAERCEADGRRYAITSQTVGDPARDVQLTIMVTPLSDDVGPAREVRRFRRLGACPATWRVGDQRRR